ncbi:TY-Chap domain-containing protein [Actinocorallia libanotica]|uniref:SseB protein N-terminal domain-containing protein n=1 Tax=Actinocorallia libanotica TaxID=46162 RepID=A0ABN1RTY6_9ACTN
MEWSEFAQRFALELANLDRDTILIVREREESRHYVQAMREPDRLYAEAVSNNFLEGPLLLGPSDEEVLAEAGWRPPTPDWTPANWWTELPPDTGPPGCAMLADMMVTALRDVQGVRRPLDLVYESFHRHGAGLIELTGFGLEPADPQRVADRRPSPIAAPVDGAPTAAHPSLEDRLADARLRGDHLAYFDLLLGAELLLPAGGTGAEAAEGGEFQTAQRDGVTHVLAFTSVQAQGAAGYAGLHRRTTFAALARSWPDPSWHLTINLDLPSEIQLDAAMILRLDTMHRSSPQATLVEPGSAPAAPDPAPADPVPAAGQAIRLPHGAQLWSERGLLAVFDAVSGGWTPAGRTA